MNQIKKKLQSNAGASIILALALVLICVMVSSVIVAAAASGVNRNQIEKTKQQEYLAITSAAQYIAENLNPSGNDRFCGELLEHVKPCIKYTNCEEDDVTVGGIVHKVRVIPTPNGSLQEDEANELDVVNVLQFYLGIPSDAVDGNIFCGSDPIDKNVMMEEGTTTFSGIFTEMMMEAATNVYKWNRASSEEFTITVEDDRIPDVKCTFNMDTNYQVKVIIKSASGDSEYSLIVELPAFSSEDPYGSRTTETCTHKCFYEYCDENGNVQFSTPEDFTFTHEVDNSTTTITWGTPVISKGGSGL